METVADFIFLGSKITAGGDCSHEIKRCLLLERKDMTILDSILKSRDVTLLTKVCLVKAMVFPVVIVAQLVKNLPAMPETWLDPWVVKIPWRREGLPTPVFWPGEFHGLYSPWGHKESDTTEQLSLPVVMYGCESWTMKRLTAEELMLLNCGVEDSWESLGQ